MKIENVIAKLPRRGNAPSNNKTPSHIIFHHDGVEILESADPLRRYVANTNAYINRGHNTTPYHIMISRDGRILQGLRLNEMTYHASNLGINRNSIAVTFQGNYMIQNITEAQKKSAKWLMSELKKQMPSLHTISWHRAVSLAGWTACPGNHAIPFIQNLTLENEEEDMGRIQELENQIQKMRLEYNEEKDRAIHAIYQNYLGREVDSEGFSFWSQRRLDELVRGIGMSKEYKERIIYMLYAKYLDRVPSLEEMRTWLESDSTPKDIEWAISNSEEAMQGR